MKNLKKISFILFLFAAAACNSKNDVAITDEYAAIKEVFGKKIDLKNLPDYANQSVPNYITKDNSNGNKITNEKALLGRVLFYDSLLSSNNKISCASCHKQNLAFSDKEIASKGVNGNTGRHSMRLINSRFASEAKFFWDERAATLEKQTTMPIQDHKEMGYSGKDGDENIGNLITKMEKVAYYPQFFKFAFGDNKITEERMQEALAQFIRSIQSFDSKYDDGRILARNDAEPFSNFSTAENLGKTLFLTPPQFDNTGVRTAGGAGCGGCHRAPEFDIDPNSLSNGFIKGIDGSLDNTVTRAPTLRDLMKTDGSSNGLFMHNGIFNNVVNAINHYDKFTGDPNARAIDRRLFPNGKPQQLNLTPNERQALVAFLQTLSGKKVYTDERWSSPF